MSGGNGDRTTALVKKEHAGASRGYQFQGGAAGLALVGPDGAIRNYKVTVSLSVASGELWTTGRGDDYVPAQNWGQNPRPARAGWANISETGFAKMRQFANVQVRDVGEPEYLRDADGNMVRIQLPVAMFGRGAAGEWKIVTTVFGLECEQRLSMMLLEAASKAESGETKGKPFPKGVIRLMPVKSAAAECEKNSALIAFPTAVRGVTLVVDLSSPAVYEKLNEFQRWQNSAVNQARTKAYRVISEKWFGIKRVWVNESGEGSVQVTAWPPVSDSDVRAMHEAATVEAIRQRAESIASPAKRDEDQAAAASVVVVESSAEDITADESPADADAEDNPPPAGDEVEGELVEDGAPDNPGNAPGMPQDAPKGRRTVKMSRDAAGAPPAPAADLVAPVIAAFRERGLKPNQIGWCLVQEGFAKRTPEGKNPEVTIEEAETLLRSLTVAPNSAWSKSLIESAAKFGGKK